MRTVWENHKTSLLLKLVSIFGSVLFAWFSPLLRYSCGPLIEHDLYNKWWKSQVTLGDLESAKFWLTDLVIYHYWSSSCLFGSLGLSIANLSQFEVIFYSSLTLRTTEKTEPDFWNFYASWLSLEKKGATHIWYKTKPPWIRQNMYRYLLLKKMHPIDYATRHKFEYVCNKHKYYKFASYSKFEVREKT